MNPLFHNYVNFHSDFISYEDFNKNFRIQKPNSFNFAFDVVDKIAKEEPKKKAVTWTNTEGEVVVATFEDMKKWSNKAANYFTLLGIKKGDKVMLILKRHLEFWPIIIALHKIGAVAVPATHLLTEKDIVYRCNAAKVVAIVQPITIQK